MIRIVAIVGICLWFSGGIILAQTSQGSPGSQESKELKESQAIQADRIDVVERRSGQKPAENFQKDKSGFHTEIRLGEAKDRYQTLPEVLEREAGLRVRSFGGLGSYSTLSIRGTNPNQSRFFVDGIPFQNSQSGEVNLADLPFENLEAVEVYRSGVPVGFAGSAIGGMVNLRTTKPDKNSTRLQLGGGSFGTGRGSVTHMGVTEDKKMGYTVFGLGEKSDQNFSFLNNQGTILLNTLDDTIDRRKNSQFERAQGSGTVYTEFGGTDVKIFTDLNHRRQGVPGPGNRQTEKPQRKYSRLTAAISTDTQELFWSQLRLESRWYFSGFRDEFFDPRSEFSSGRTNSLAQSDTSGFQISPTLYLLDYFQIIRFSGGGEKEDFRRERRNSDHRVLDKEPVRNRKYTTGQVEDEIHLFSGRVLLIPGLQWDRYQDTWEEGFSLPGQNPYIRKATEFTNPRMGFLWKAYGGRAITFAIKANANRSARIASFLELFGERGQILGNQNLIPERSTNQDSGFVLDYRGGGLRWNTEISYYRKDIRDMILFIPNSQFSLRAENVDSAKIHGYELRQGLDWKGWKARVHYTYQIARNTSESISLKGKYLPLRPMHEFFGNLSYQWKDWTLGGDFTYIGAVFRDRTNEYINFLPARDIYGCYMIYEFQSSWKVSLEVKNLTDRRFEDMIGYPLPGRMWYGSVGYVF